jgi:hypothetical protein
VKSCIYAILIFFVSTATAFADVSVSSPTKGEYVNSPFYLSASASSCSSAPVSSMGYSLDDSSYTAVTMGQTSITANVPVAKGTHTVHVKAWNTHGAVCVTDVPINVTGLTANVSSTSSSTASGILISNPSDWQKVSSPFTVNASAQYCEGQPVSSMGFSIDGSSQTTLFRGQTSFSGKGSASAGTHKLHVKSWGNGGTSCMATVTVQVTQVTNDVVANVSVVPSGAVKVSNIEMLSSWKGVNDSAVSGWSSGVMSLVGSPAYSGQARKFVTQYSNYGAHRYSVSFNDNRTARNFFYDGWVYIAGPSTNLGNLEMDLNQTMPNGQTVIFGVQCDGYSSTWDFTVNRGTASNPNIAWAHANAHCNPREWSTNTWHHVQMSYSRNDSGWITYKSVWLDGHQFPINVTAYSAFSLGWASAVVTNFQVDGRGTGSGTNTVYLDDLTVSRW